MYKGLITSAILLLSAKIWALSCSAPVTISDPRLDASRAHVFANEKDDAAVIWVSIQGKKEAATISYKTQNSTWSSSEFISGWEEFIYRNRCFVNLEGDIRAHWELERGDNDIIQTTEKKVGNSWTAPSDWVSLNPNVHFVDVEFDSLGKHVFFGETYTSVTTKPAYPGGFTYEKTIHGIAIMTKLQEQLKQNWDTFTLDEDTYGIYELSLVTNKKEGGYVFWESSKHNDKILMGRKIQNGHFIMEPEVISHSLELIHDLKASLNEKGEVAVACRDKDTVKIYTKLDHSWSKPFTFATKEEDPFDMEISIDNEGNILAVCWVVIDEIDLIKTIYKPFGKAWMAPVLVSHPGDDNWVPEIKPDGKGNFVMIWQQEVRNRQAIIGATFSTTTQTWSDSQLLSPKGESCFNFSYAFGIPGKGYISWTTSPNGFDESVQIAELSN